MIGPAAFVTAWAANGAATKGYSPIDDAISRLAAVGTTTRPFMTAGFVCFGLAVPIYASALRRYLPRSGLVGGRVHRNRHPRSGRFPP